MPTRLRLREAQPATHDPRASPHPPERAGTHHYVANRETILGRQRQKRRDPIAGEELRARERERIAGLTSAERERRAQLNRDWYRRNPRPTKENVRQHLRHRYGLSPEQREQMLTQQEGCCYLCGEPLDLTKPRTAARQP